VDESLLSEIQEIVGQVLRSDDFTYSKYCFISFLDLPLFIDMTYDEVKRWFRQYEADIVVEFLTHGFEVTIVPVENDILIKTSRIYSIDYRTAKPY